MTDPFVAFNWPYSVRHVPSTVGRYNRNTTSFDEGASAATAITGHKTVIRRADAVSFRARPDIGEVREGDVFFATTTTLDRDDIIEFDEDEGGTVVSRYRVERPIHRQGLMSTYTGTLRQTYLLREVQHDGQ